MDMIEHIIAASRRAAFFSVHTSGSRILDKPIAKKRQQLESLEAKLLERMQLARYIEIAATIGTIALIFAAFMSGRFDSKKMENQLSEIQATLKAEPIDQPPHDWISWILGVAVMLAVIGLLYPLGMLLLNW
ncbi:MAG: hypothetical protein ACFFB3_18270 [Candidatus Hodarchaeota archaeon]